MRDHDSLRITQLNGLYDRGEDETCPADKFLSCQNFTFTQRGVARRDGSSLSLTKANIRRIAIYRRVGEAQRLLILDSSGNLYDSIDLGTPILTIGAMTDFSLEVMYNRAYITPHDGVTGLSGQKVYVYSGSGVARAAAGAAPTGFTLGLADSGLSGKVEAGVHAVGVCFLTDTGFITAPGGFAQITNIGGRKLAISSIPVGPTYVTGRVLVASKIITDFDGNFDALTYYFIPSGTISNNTATTATVDFYDSELLSDASYLLDQLAEIPAGVCIKNYGGKLVVAGENANQSTGRVSKGGEPESVDSTEGFFLANPGDAGSGIKNLLVYRDSLVILKGQRCYGTLDTGDSAVFWKVTLLDASIGTECHGVGKILDYGDTLEETAIIADRKGLCVFNGAFADMPLTFNIEDVWDRVNKAAFQTVEVAIDPVNAYIYVAVPLDSATSPSHVLFGDYSLGLTAEKIKWMPWAFPVTPQSILVDTNNTTKLPVFKYAGRTGNVYQIDPLEDNDFGTAIDHWVELALLPHEYDKKTKEGIYHFAGISLRARGTGSLVITLRNQDSTLTLTPTAITLSTAPGMDFHRLFNFTAQKCAVKLRVNEASGELVLTRATLMSKWMWSEY